MFRIISAIFTMYPGLVTLAKGLFDSKDVVTFIYDQFSLGIIFALIIGNILSVARRRRLLIKWQVWGRGGDEQRQDENQMTIWHKGAFDLTRAQKWAFTGVQLAVFVAFFGIVYYIDWVFVSGEEEHDKEVSLAVSPGDNETIDIQDTVSTGDDETKEIEEDHGSWEGFLHLSQDISYFELSCHLDMTPIYIYHLAQCFQNLNKRLDQLSLNRKLTEDERIEGLNKVFTTWIQLKRLAEELGSAISAYWLPYLFWSVCSLTLNIRHVTDEYGDHAGQPKEIFYHILTVVLRSWTLWFVYSIGQAMTDSVS
jgi:hypothetical protein